MTDLVVRTKLTLKSAVSLYCNYGSSSFWYPVAPGTTSLPAPPAITTNANPTPANAIAIPEDFNENDLCYLFQDLLPITQPPVYPSTITPTVNYQPYTEIVPLVGVTAARLSITEYPYALTLSTGAIVAVTKAALTYNPVVGVDFSYGWDSVDSTTETDNSPINVWYRKYVYQTVYTVADFEAVGATPNRTYNRLKWYVTGAVPANNSIRGMTIRLFHTTATNGQTLATVAGGGSKTTVYSDGTTTDFTLAETTGELTVNFTTPFTWNGTNNVCVEVCTSQNQNLYEQAGQVRAVEEYYASRVGADDDPGNACTLLTPDTTSDYKPAVQLLA